MGAVESLFANNSQYTIPVMLNKHTHTYVPFLYIKTVTVWKRNACLIIIHTRFTVCIYEYMYMTSWKQMCAIILIILYQMCHKELKCLIELSFTSWNCIEFSIE